MYVDKYNALDRSQNAHMSMMSNAYLKGNITKLEYHEAVMVRQERQKRILPKSYRRRIFHAIKRKYDGTGW